MIRSGQCFSDYLHGCMYRRSNYDTNELLWFDGKLCHGCKLPTCGGGNCTAQRTEALETRARTVGTRKRLMYDRVSNSSNPEYNNGRCV